MSTLTSYCVCVCVLRRFHGTAPARPADADRVEADTHYEAQKTSYAVCPSGDRGIYKANLWRQLAWCRKEHKEVLAAEKRDALAHKRSEAIEKKLKGKMHGQKRKQDVSKKVETVKEAKEKAPRKKKQKVDTSEYISATSPSTAPTIVAAAVVETEARLLPLPTSSTSTSVVTESALSSLPLLPVSSSVSDEAVSHGAVTAFMLQLEIDDPSSSSSNSSSRLRASTTRSRIDDDSEDEFVPSGAESELEDEDVDIKPSTVKPRQRVQRATAAATNSKLATMISTSAKAEAFECSHICRRENRCLVRWASTTKFDPGKQLQWVDRSTLGNNGRDLSQKKFEKIQTYEKFRETDEYMELQDVLPPYCDDSDDECFGIASSIIKLCVLH
jgi:hypothetical protein